MSYERNDMYYHDYRWPARGDEVQVKQATVFQPDNGNVILYLINLLTHNLFDGTILEIMIHEFLPKTVDTIRKACDWIVKQGDHYYKLILRSIAESD